MVFIIMAGMINHGLPEEEQDQLRVNRSSAAQAKAAAAKAMTVSTGIRRPGLALDVLTRPGAV
jgi:hypothetical protein